MDDKHEIPEFDLEDILNEFHDISLDTQEEKDAEKLNEMLTLKPELEEVSVPDAQDINLDALLGEATQRFEPAGKQEEIHLEGLSFSEEPAPALEGMAEDTAAEKTSENEQVFIPAPVVYTPRSRLKELKKKLVSGPEKRYYQLSELGVGKLQTAIAVNLLLVLLCAAITTMFVLGLVPEDRLRLVIFSQVLAMLISALLGCQQMIDGLGDILKLRFTVNTLLTLTFFACVADSYFCLRDLRVPCCAAFSLEMTMALLGRYHRRTTEMAQMDTMRKAVRLHGVVRHKGYLEDRDGLLRTEGEVEDFMEQYSKPSAPEKVQSVYAFLALLASAGIAVFTGMRHDVAMAVQILSTTLLVAVPASFFISITRPAAILEQRLHLVGTVLCGWRGVKGLKGKVAFPLEDQDLFPQGSTKLNGVKFYGDRDPDEVVAYSAALISRAGGGLAPVFQKMLDRRGGKLHKVENFHDYGGGGIGGEVCGEPVLLGTLDFLQDMGVEIPEGTMVNQAVYASIDGQLGAVYAISYAKMRSSAAGLVTLCGYRKLRTVMLGGDFMVTEDFLRAKFGVKTKRILFPEAQERERLRQVQPDPEAPVLAMTTREELISTAYAVTGARALSTATKLGVAIHMLGGILGLLIMLVLAYLGSTELLTPTNVLLYQLVWAVPGVLVTEWARIV